MQRSRSQVLFSYLPESVYIHDSGLTVRSYSVRGEGIGDAINKAVLLREVDRHLQNWPEENRQGFPASLATSRDEITIETPEQVRYEIWPLVFECANEQCKRIRTVRSLEEISAHPRCRFCRFPLRQLRYFSAHRCGAIKQMYVPKCDLHGYDHVYFEDTGSFLTAVFRCRECGGQIVRRTAQTPCGCNLTDPDGRAMMRAYTVRDTRTFYAQYVPLINFQSHVFKRLQEHAERGAIAVASYLGLIESISEALAEAEDRGGNRMPPQEWAQAEAKYRTMGLSEEDIQTLKKTKGPKEFGLAAVRDVPQSILDIGTRRPVIERAMLFDQEHHPEHSLETARAEADKRGHVGGVARLDMARTHASAMGIEAMHVTWDFPIALAAYGYTRGTADPTESRILSFRKPNQYQGKVPIFAVATKTEAVILTLSPVAVLRWLANSGLGAGQVAEDPYGAKTAILALYAAEELNPEPAKAVRTLVHSVAHCMLRALGDGQVGFGESSLAEWVVPETLTIAIYANSLNSDTLGAFWTLLNNRTLEWLESSKQRVYTCENDPLCHQREPRACEQCMFLAFGCQMFNDDLSRKTLADFWLNA
jgi:uncharacterized CHY-type Zn-finger protein